MDTDTKRGRPCEDGAEAGAREPQGKEAWSRRKPGTRKEPSAEPSEKTNPVDTRFRISGLQSSEHKFCCFKSPSLRHLITAAIGNEWASLVA